MSPVNGEDKARQIVDRLLSAAGWRVFDADQANIMAGRGVAIREFPLPGYGFADYLLYVDGKAAGVIEAKKEGTTLTGVETQSNKYAKGLPSGLPRWDDPLLFSYQSTGVETRFTNGLDPAPRSHSVFCFHRPETIAEWLELPFERAADAAPEYVRRGKTFLARLRHMPELVEEGLWPAQVKAIQNLEGNGTRYITGPEQWDGHKIHENKWTTNPKRVVPPGCIFITVKGAGVGKIFPGVGGAIGRDIYAFEPSAQHCGKFIEYALKLTVQDILRNVVGDIPGISKRHILDHEVMIPPLDQKKRIVAEIEKQFSRLDEAVANLKRVKANLKRYKSAVLKSAVEGCLVETEAELARREGRSYETGEQLLQRILETRRSQWKGRGKYKEPAGPDTTDLPELPEAWVWANFERAAERVTVGHVGSMKDEYVEKGIPFLRSQNVRPNRYDPEGLKYISERFHRELRKSMLKSDDIVVVRSGSVGVSCVIPEQLPEANCSDLVIIKAPRGVLPSFGVYYMNSVVETRVAAGKVGIALTHFNTQSVAKLPLPIPPMAEQHRIVAEVDRRLSLIREIESQVDANLKRAYRLRQAVLSRAFSGDLIGARSQSTSGRVPEWHDQKASFEELLND